MDITSFAWKPSTAETVSSILHAHLLPRLGTMAVDRIDRQRILAFRAHMVRETTGRQGALQLSAARTNRVMTVLRQILRESALQDGRPDPFVGIRPLRERTASVRPFTWKEVERLVEAAPHHLSDYILVRCLTGLRSGEVNGLRWDQVDFDAEVIRVTRARVRSQEVIPKNVFSERDIPMTTKLCDALLRQWIRTGTSDGFVFQAVVGGPIDTSNFANRDWPRILERASLPPRRPYHLRHTAACLMLAAGENPTWIAKVLGHADCTMLWMVYARFVPNLTRTDGSAMEAMVERLAA